MARITIEDCLEQVENRYELVHLAVKRVKQIKEGADFLIKILEEVGEELDTRTFFNVANIRGIIYDSGISGGPCALMTALVHQDPAGGVSLLQVRGGVFRPVVDFNCPQRYWED